MGKLPDSMLDKLLAFATEAAQQAGALTLKYFRTDLEVDSKPDHTPVTVADRESEKLLRQKIEERYPGHGILGEEFGAVREGAGLRWLLDPIDGTQSFIRGVPFYGVMMGLEQEGEPVLGVVHFPALGETLAARSGGGATWNGKPARVSRISEIGDAALLLTDPRGFAPAGREDAYQRLRTVVKFERTWGDCYGHALVATGRADVMLDPLLNEWDCCALLPILEEAGGRFTDWSGKRTTRGGSGISTNGALHDAVMQLVNFQFA